MASMARLLARSAVTAARSAATRSTPRSAAALLAANRTPQFSLLASSASRTLSTTPARRAEGEGDAEDKKKALKESFKTYDQVKSKVEKVCKEFEKINQEKFSLNAHFINDLGLDSLDQVELVMAMESEFGFEIPDAEAEKLTKPIDVIKFICEKAEIAVPK
jgi:NADH dehydrogenase (ubiquinone) 1 alpha/beta subcomplex 1